ncbi:hypothetical protein [Marinobacter changyiensis]|uniref:hypothetical protein n=1 Tax=Marinobacter changyiensis TaxID=2604091 RepID=UPI0012656918|nr:hypothetical protein [Marinobacter changyiensis]
MKILTILLHRSVASLLVTLLTIIFCPVSQAEECEYTLPAPADQQAFIRKIQPYLESDCYQSDPSDGATVIDELNRLEIWRDETFNYFQAQKAFLERKDAFKAIKKEVVQAESKGKISPSGATELNTVLDQMIARSQITYERLVTLSPPARSCDTMTLGNIWNGNPLNSIDPEALKQGCRSGFPPLAHLDLLNTLEAACTDSDCQTEFSLVRKLGNQYKMAQSLSNEIVRPGSEAVFAKVKEKDALWDEFFYQSRPMLPWEIWATDKVERWLTKRFEENKNFEEGYNTPPKTQVILFHPGIGYEWVDTAEAAHKGEVSLYVEVLGINRWREQDRVFGYVSGVSVVAALSDRVRVNNVGGGLMLTLDNDYQVGVNYYGDGDIGVVVSMNLMNLFRDSYVNAVRNWK